MSNLSSTNRSKQPYCWRAIALTLAITLQFGSQLVGAAPARADQEEQNQRQRQEAMDKKERDQRSDVFLQKQTAADSATDLPEENLRFPIQTIALTGERLEQFTWLAEYLEPYQGRQIGLQGINLIVKRATNALIDRGYTTTRILIPEQDLSTGTLKLQLIPGVIHDIRFAEGTKSGNWKTAFPTRPGEILNLRHLEQGLEQLKRVPSQDADMQLVPADKPGESDIVIALKQSKPWKVVLSVDDSGSEATGKLQLSQTVAIDNLLGANDLFNVSFTHDGEREGKAYGSKGNSLYYSRPNGDWTYSFSRNEYQYHQRILTGSETITYSGTNQDIRVTAEKLLNRNQSGKTHLQLGLTVRDGRNYVEDTEISVQRKDTTVLTLGLSHKQYFGQTTLDTRLTHKQGMPWLGAQPDTSTGPTTRYHIWNFDTTLTKPVTLGKAKGQYRLSFTGQYTNNHLYAADNFSIGSRYTVRGFDGELTLAAEQGWYLQNELAVPVAPNGTSLYLGLDYGQVSGPSAAGLQGKALAGTIVGLRGPLGKVSQYDIFVGWPLKKPDGFTTAHTTTGFQWTCQL